MGGGNLLVLIFEQATLDAALLMVVLTLNTVQLSACPAPQCRVILV